MGSVHTRILQRLRHRLARQDGFALVAALGMSVVFGAVGTSVMVYSTSGAGHSARMKADQQAFALAEAALNDAYSVVYNASNPTMSNAVPTTTQTLDADSGLHWSSDGAMVGTLLYMSPEALSREAPSPFFDMWSLSVVLYECLTGMLPFTGKTATEMLASVTTATAVPPSALRQECPAIIDEFFARALHRQANRRFPDAAAMQEALRRLRAEC